MSRILVVDDEEGIREILRDYLEFEGHEIFEAPGGQKAWELLTSHEVDLVISDVKMPAGTGTDLLNLIKARNHVAPPVVFITGYSDFNTDEAYAMGVEGFLHKPFTRASLVEMVGRMIRPRITNRDGAELANLPSLNFTEGGLGAAIAAGRLAVARGGLCLKDVPGPLTVDQTCAIRFAGQLFGGGVVRWYRSQGRVDQGDAGLELFWLTPGQDAAWTEALSGVEPRIYIPRQVNSGKN